MSVTYAYSAHNREWLVFIRNCRSDETCCRDWFCVNPKDPTTGEPDVVGWAEGLELIKNNVDVWHEYALVHIKARDRYEKKNHEHLCS